MLEIINEEEVIDTSTNLIWKRNPEPRLYTWYELMSANFGEWKVPSIKELLTIVDYEKVNPACINESFSFNDNSYSFWCSSSCVHSKYSAWSVNFVFGYVESNLKKYTCSVRLVRSKYD